MPNLTPFFSYPKGNAKEAADFYVSVFPGSRVVRTSYYGDNMPLPKGTVLTVEFELDGKRFIALNGGPQDGFNMAVSFVVNCKDQAEVDHYWSAFADGGQEIQCGWIKDRFGFCWQVVPDRFFELISTPDKAQSQRVMQAMMKMKKFVIAELEAAAQSS